MATATAPGTYALVPKVVNAGATVAGVEFYLENWLPFLRSTDAFTALALRLDANGDPSEWYRAGQDTARLPDLRRGDAYQPSRPAAGLSPASALT
jgi:hypothetical protein